MTNAIVVRTQPTPSKKSKKKGRKPARQPRSSVTVEEVRVGRGRRKRSNRPSRRNRDTRVTAPRSIGVQHKSYFQIRTIDPSKGHINIKGKDFLTLVTAGEPNYAILVQQAIQPRNAFFESTRLSLYAKMYEKYCFRNLTFHYSPACSTSSSGSLVMAYDKDVSDTYVESDPSLIKALVGHQDSVTTPFWEEASISCPLTDTQDFYYTDEHDGEPRITSQGQIVIASIIGAVDSTDVGELWVEYDCDLYDQQLEAESVVAIISAGENIPTGARSLSVTANTEYSLSSLINTLETTAGALNFSVPSGAADIVLGALRLAANGLFLVTTVIAVRSSGNTVALAPAAALVKKKRADVPEVSITGGLGLVLDQTEANYHLDTIPFMNPSQSTISAPSQNVEQTYNFVIDLANENRVTHPHTAHFAVKFDTTATIIVEAFQMSVTYIPPGTWPGRPDLPMFKQVKPKKPLSIDLSKLKKVLSREEVEYVLGSDPDSIKYDETCFVHV